MTLSGDSSAAEPAPTLAPAEACDETTPPPLGCGTARAVDLTVRGDDIFAPNNAIPSRADGAAEAISQDLRRSANTQWERRPAPTLQRMSDGSLRYRGSRLSAQIAPDGEVTFTHQSDTTIHAEGLGVAGQFGLTEALMRAAGTDPLRSEKTWFLRETETLRAELAEQAQGVEARRAASIVERRAQAIWSDADKPATVRRRELFELWDDCEVDAIGARARDRIVAFVRRALPVGSADAFTASELAVFNARRSSSERFAPYS